jgi:hypothetical protein
MAANLRSFVKGPTDAEAFEDRASARRDRRDASADRAAAKADRRALAESRLTDDEDAQAD